MKGTKCWWKIGVIPLIAGLIWELDEMEAKKVDTMDKLLLVGGGSLSHGFRQSVSQ